MKKLGCNVPNSLDALRVRDVSFEYFPSEGLSGRVRLFGSVMYRGYSERRAQAVLESAQGQQQPKERAEWIDIDLGAAGSLEGKGGAQHQRQASWAKAMFGVSLPDEQRVAYMLGAVSYTHLTLPTNREV